MNVGNSVCVRRTATVGALAALGAFVVWFLLNRFAFRTNGPFNVGAAALRSLLVGAIVGAIAAGATYAVCRATRGKSGTNGEHIPLQRVNTY